MRTRVGSARSRVCAMMPGHAGRLPARIRGTRQGRWGSRRRDRRRACRLARRDTHGDGNRLATKIAALRIFENEEGKFDRSLLDVNGDALVVSQFTLIADTQKGNRPSFSDAAPPEEAKLRYDRFCEALVRQGVDVARGAFGARMAVELVNDGPVTIVLG